MATPFYATQNEVAVVLKQRDSNALRRGKDKYTWQNDVYVYKITYCTRFQKLMHI